MAKTNHGAGSASGKAAGDNRRDTRSTARTERVTAAQPQMERKPFENGGQMPPRKLYVSFVQGGVFGFSIVPLLGPLDEPAIRGITRGLETIVGGRKPVSIIAITVLEDQADNPRYN